MLIENIFPALINWLDLHQTLLTWMGLVSIIMFIGSALLLPWLVVLIPADYFAHQSRTPHSVETETPDYPH